MKKIIVLIVSLLMLSACANDIGEQMLVCPDLIFVSPSEEWFGEGPIPPQPIRRDFSIKYYSENNYITSIFAHISFEYDDEIKAVVEKEFNGDKQAWLAWLNNEMQYRIHDNKIEELDGTIGLDILRENPERPSGWRGLIVPDEYNFDKVRNEYVKFRLCEVE